MEIWINSLLCDHQFEVSRFPLFSSLAPITSSLHGDSDRRIMRCILNEMYDVYRLYKIDLNEDTLNTPNSKTR